MFANQRPKALTTKRLLSRFLVDAKPWDKKPDSHGSRGTPLRGDMYLTNYLTVKGGSGRDEIGFDSFHVQFTEEAKKLIEANMVFIGNDSLYFELIVFKTHAVLYVKHNQIIGSRILSRCISLDSIPALLIERKN